MRRTNTLLAKNIDLLSVARTIPHRKGNACAFIYDRLSTVVFTPLYSSRFVSKNNHPVKIFLRRQFCAHLSTAHAYSWLLSKPHIHKEKQYLGIYAHNIVHVRLEEVSFSSVKQLFPPRKPTKCFGGKHYQVLKMTQKRDRGEKGQHQAWFTKCFTDKPTSTP